MEGPPSYVASGDDEPKKCLIDAMRQTPVLRRAFEGIFTSLSISEICRLQAVSKWMCEEKPRILQAGSVSMMLPSQAEASASSGQQQEQQQGDKHQMDMELAHHRLQCAVENANIPELNRLCTKWYGNKRVLDLDGYRTPVYLACRSEKEAVVAVREVALGILFAAGASDRRKPFLASLLSDRDTPPNTNLALILLSLGILGEVVDAATALVPSSPTLQAWVRSMSMEMNLSDEKGFSDDQRCAVAFHQLFQRVRREEVEACLVTDEQSREAFDTVASKTQAVAFFRERLLIMIEAILERFPYSPAFANTPLVPEVGHDERDSPSDQDGNFKRHLQWLKQCLEELGAKTYGQLQAALHQPVRYGGPISTDFLSFLRKTSDFGRTCAVLSDEQLEVVARYELLASSPPNLDAYLSCINVEYESHRHHEVGEKHPLEYNGCRSVIREYAGRLVGANDDWGIQLQADAVTRRSLIDKALSEFDLDRGHGGRMRIISGQESYSSYIYKVLKKVHSQMGISKLSMQIMNTIVNDFFERLVLEACGPSLFSTLNLSEVQTAVRLVFPPELARLATIAGNEAVERFTGWSPIQSIKKSDKAGLLFPIGRIGRYIKKLVEDWDVRVGAGAPVFLAASLEFLASEILKLAGNVAREVGGVQIGPRDIKLAVHNNFELRCCVFSYKGNDLSDINSVLMPSDGFGGSKGEGGEGGEGGEDVEDDD